LGKNSEASVRKRNGQVIKYCHDYTFMLQNYNMGKKTSEFKTYSEYAEKLAQKCMQKVLDNYCLQTLLAYQLFWWCFLDFLPFQNHLRILCITSSIYKCFKKVCCYQHVMLTLKPSTNKWKKYF